MKTRRLFEKLFILALVAMLCFATAACNGGDGELTPTPSPEPENVIIMSLEESYFINEAIDLTPTLLAGYTLDANNGIAIKKDGEVVATNPEGNIYAFPELGEYEIVYTAVKGTKTKTLTLSTTIVEDETLDPISIPTFSNYVNNSSDGRGSSAVNLMPTLLDDYQLKEEGGFFLRDSSGKILSTTPSYTFALAGTYSVEYTAVKNGSTKTKSRTFTVDTEVVKVVRFLNSTEEYSPNTNYTAPAEGWTFGDGRMTVYGQFQYETNTLRLNKKESTMEIRFYGTGFELRNGVGTGACTFDLYIDGEFIMNIDSYNETAVTDKLMYTNYELEPGDHVIKIVNMGKNAETDKGGKNVNINTITFFHAVEDYETEGYELTEEDTNIILTGDNWTFANGVFKSENLEDKLTFKYNGLGIRLYVNKSRDGDFIQIKIGTLVFDVDCNSTDNESNVIAFEFMNSYNGEHEIEIENMSGGLLEITGFDIVKVKSADNGGEENTDE